MLLLGWAEIQDYFCCYGFYLCVCLGILDVFEDEFIGNVNILDWIFGMFVRYRGMEICIE